LWQAVVSPVVEQLPQLSHVLVSSMTDLIDASDLSLDEQYGHTRVLSLADHLPSDANAPSKEADVALDDILYLQYTGGTTGTPKGAQLSSRHVFSNNVQADLFYGYRLGQETVASAFPLFHIGGAAVLFNP
jgi:long-chain acyl-CoA synthetase